MRPNNYKMVIERIFRVIFLLFVNIFSFEKKKDPLKEECSQFANITFISS